MNCIQRILYRAVSFSMFAALFFAATPAQATSSQPPVPDAGVYLGAVHDLTQTGASLSQFNTDTGIKHAMFMEFVGFPLTTTEQSRITVFINSCIGVGAMPTITLETFSGLNSYTTNDIRSFATYLNGFSVPMVLRWNHEMNGSWYAWGQQPTAYIAKFREFATILHQFAPGVAMAWTPNQGWGYGWTNGTYSIKNTSADFAVLDTNHDGLLTEADDPYGPYYPGDAYVDWVGISFYHWGNDRAKNQVPWLGKWGHANGISNSIPNFHNLFAVAKNKPMMIAETAAFYDLANVNGGGATELAIKTNWLKQVYNLTDSTQPKLQVSLPKIKAIFWFNYKKFESEVNGIVDWRVNSTNAIISAYQSCVTNSYFLRALYTNDSVSINTAPAAVAPNEVCTNVSIQYRATAGRDIILALLDPVNGYAYYGGQTKSVAAGMGSLTFNPTVTNNPSNGTHYIWDVIIVPTGGSWTSTLAHATKNVSVSSTDYLSYTVIPNPLRPTQTSTIAFSYGVAGIGKRLTVELLDPAQGYKVCASGFESLAVTASGTISVPLTIHGAPTSGSYYVLSAFIAVGTNNYTTASAIAQTNVTVGGDSLKVVSAPLAVCHGQACTVKCQYYCESPRYLSMDLLRPSANYAWFGGSSIYLARGSGTVYVAVSVVNNPAAAQDYLWRGFLSASQGNFANATTSAVVDPVSVLKDAVNIIATPVYFQPALTYPITLRYAKNGTASKYVQVDLLDPLNNYAWHGSATATLPTASSNGEVTVNLPVVNNPLPGYGYALSAFIAPTGQGWSGATASDVGSALVSRNDIAWVNAPGLLTPRSSQPVTLNYNVYSGSTGVYLTVNLRCVQNGVSYGTTNSALSAGTGQITLNIPVSSAATISTNYILEAYVSTKAGIRTNVSAVAETTTAVLQDTLTFHSYPGSIWTPGTWTVKINYTAAAARKIQLDLLSSSTYLWRAGNEVTIPAGSGVATINVAVPNSFATGSHLWSAYIAPTNGSYATRTGQVVSPAFTAQRNPVQIVSAPSTVQRGKTYNVTLAYDVTVNSEAHIDLLQGGVFTWQGGAWSTVGTGVGTKTYQITVSASAPLGTNYLWSSWIGPVGAGYSGRTFDNLLSPATVTQ